MMSSKKKLGWGKLSLLLVTVPLLLLVGLLLTATQWMEWGIKKGLPGMEVHLEKGGINLLDGRVELTGLALAKGGSEKLQISLLAVDLSLKSLFKKQVILDQLQVAQGNIWIEALPSGGWQVAGVDLPPSSPESQAQKQKQEPAQPIDNLGVGFRELLLDQLTFHLKEGGRQQTVGLNHLQVTSQGVFQTSSSLGIVLDAGLDKARLQLKGQAAPFAAPLHFKGNLNIKGLALALAKPYLAEIPPSLQGSASTNMDLDLSYAEQGESQFNLSGDLNLHDFAVEQDALAVQLPLTGWQGKVVASLPPASDHQAAPKVTLTGSLKLSGLSMTQEDHTVQLPQTQWLGVVSASLPPGAKPTGSIKGMVQSEEGLFKLGGTQQSEGAIDGVTFKKLLLEGINVALADNSVAVDGVALADLYIQTVGKKNTLLVVEGVDLKQAQYDPSGRVTLDSVAVTGSSLFLHRNSVNKWPWSDLTPADSASDAEKKPEVAGQDSDEQQGDGAEKPALSYRLGSLSFPKGVVISLLDEGVSPVVRVGGQIDRLEVAAIDSLTPDKATSFNIAGRVGEYGKFQFSGEGKPLLSSPDVIVKGFIKAISLPPFSPYVVPELGYNFGSGSLDVDTDLTVAQSGIQAKNGIKLKMFKLVSAKNKKSAEIAEKLPIPINSALDFLRDGDGDISMSIPVAGTVENPDVKLDDIISKVMGKVTVKAAKTTAFAALGPIGLALSAVEMIGTAAVEAERQSNLEPIFFAPGSSQLSADSVERLNKLATYLTTKQKGRVSACGVVVAADEAALVQSADTVAQTQPTDVAAQTQPAGEALASQPAVEMPPSSWIYPDAIESIQPVTPEKVVQPQREEQVVVQKGGRFHTVRVASFQSLDRAKREKGLWEKRGYTASIQALPGRGGREWQAVSVGLFDQRSQATELAGELNKTYQTQSIVAQIVTPDVVESRMVASAQPSAAQVIPANKTMAAQRPAPAESPQVMAQPVYSSTGGKMDQPLLERLNALAVKRSSVVKNFLITQGKVAEDRVFACTPAPPQPQDKEGPRVGFSF
ncbi:MAG: DUF748 domain-containing protein [Magnetococcales bacterium]|nr:DUF748 domain-containing protein [Magnetococcales bacterium]